MSSLQMTLVRPCLAAQRCAVRAKAQLGGSALRVSLPRSQRRAPARLVTVAAVDSAAVLEDVRGIIAEQLGTDLEKVTAESKFVDLGADSLDTVEIMMALEEKFDLQLDEEGAEKISTVQQAADLIASQVDSA